MIGSVIQFLDLIFLHFFNCKILIYLLSHLIGFVFSILWDKDMLRKLYQSPQLLLTYCNKSCGNPEITFNFSPCQVLKFWSFSRGFFDIFLFILFPIYSGSNLPNQHPTCGMQVSLKVLIPWLLGAKAVRASYLGHSGLRSLWAATRDNHSHRSAGSYQ